MGGSELVFGRQQQPARHAERPNEAVSEPVAASASPEDHFVPSWAPRREHLEPDLEGDALHGVFELFKVDSTLVGERMEEVEVIHRFLLVPEDEVDPEVKTTGDIVTLKGSSVLS